MKTITPISKAEYDFRRWLQTELTERCKKNPRYSLRSFALLLEMDPSSVSQMLSGRRKASTKVINAICDRLSAHPAKRNGFLKQSSSGRKAKSGEQPTAELLALDAFSVISDWYHFAILELTMVDDFQYRTNWIARSLGISVSEVNIAVERMKRLNLLREEDGRLVRTNGLITNFAPGMTSAAHKSLQRQIIAKALDAVDNCAQDEKDITSITMAIDPLKLPEARKRITKFRRELSDFLQDGNQEKVYNLALQLYPISKPISKNMKPKEEL